MLATLQIKKTWQNKSFGPWFSTTPTMLGHHQFTDLEGTIRDGDVLFRIHEGQVKLHVQTPDRGDVPLSQTKGWKWREAVV